MSQLSFPAVTPAGATNPFCWIAEPADAFGVKITASPSYTAVAVAENVTITMNNVVLPITQAGSFIRYSMQTGGRNYPFHIDVQPQNINFIKRGTNIPDLTTPAGTNQESLQFLMKYKQSSGTASLVDHYLFLLGCRIASTTLNVTPQQKLSVGMDLVAREVTISTTSGLTTPTIPDFSGITGAVIVDADAGSNPLTIDAKTYATDGFSLTVDQGLIVKPYNGSGLIDVSPPGLNVTTGSFNTVVGDEGLSLETILNSQQTGVTMSYRYKSGTMVATIASAVLTTGTRSFPGAPTSILDNPISFEAKQTTLATS